MISWLYNELRNVILLGCFLLEERECGGMGKRGGWTELAKIGKQQTACRKKVMFPLSMYFNL